MRAPLVYVPIPSISGIADMPIEALHVSTLHLRLLKRAGCRTVDDVVSRWPTGLLRVNGIGPELMRVLYERLRHLVPHLHPLPPSPRPRRRALARQPVPRDHRLRRLEEERIEVLRMLWRGMTARQIATQRRCSSPAVYARKRRLVLHFAQPTSLQRLPQNLQHFVLKEYEKLQLRTLRRHSPIRHSHVEALSTKRQSGAGYEGV